MTASKAVLNLIQQAKDAGMPKDQLENFVTSGYYPIPRALQFHAACREIDHVKGQAIVGYGGSRSEAKTHAVAAQVALDDCVRYNGLNCLFLRKIKSSAKTQLSNVFIKLTNIIPKNNIITLKNGSTIHIGGFKDRTQLNSILGIEFDIIIIEDATTLDGDTIDLIRGSCRSSKPGWKPRLYMPTNPGSVGHAYYKNLLYDPYKEKREINTRFIHAQFGDNPFIDEGYRCYLNELTGLLKLIWRDGSFDVAAGQFFTPFDENVHVVKSNSILLDTQQTYWLSMDYGRQHWNVAFLFVRMGEDTYIIDECAHRGSLPEQNAYYINAMLSRHGLSADALHTRVAGHDIWAKRGTTETIHDQFSNCGIVFSQAQIDRINGATKMLQMLGNPNPASDEIYIKPNLYIFENCKGLIDQLPKMIHDEKRPEDYLKVNTNVHTGKGGDDFVDAARYGLMESMAFSTSNHSAIRKNRGQTYR